MSKAKKGLAQAKKIPVPTPPVQPTTPDQAALQAYQTAYAVYVQQVQARENAIGQAEAGVKQAEAGVDQLDDQVKSTNEQLSDSAKQQTQSDAFSNESDQLTNEGDALQADQKKLQDEQKDLGDDQKDIADLKARPITVGDVAVVKTENAPSTVRRQDGKQAVTITGTPSGTDLGAVNTALQAKVATFTPPPGVQVVQGGASEDQAKAFSQLGLAMALAIALVFIIMVATFKSLVQPLILLVSIPFAATGALIGLLVTGTPLGRTGHDRSADADRHRGDQRDRADRPDQPVPGTRGMDLPTAIIDGARLRLRPIMMTAAATCARCCRWGWASPAGGGFISKPLAVVVIGGLVSSTLLTLLLVPVLYCLVARVAGKKARAQLARPVPVHAEDDYPTEIR